MSAIEVVAVGAGLISVYLTVRQNIWSWPIGIINVILFAYMFFGAKLYSDAILQGVFFILSIYGWWQWLRVKDRKAPKEDPMKKVNYWEAFVLAVVIFVLFYLGQAYVSSYSLDNQIAYSWAVLLAFCIYGWLRWGRGKTVTTGDEATQIPVTRITWTHTLCLAILGATFYVLYSNFMAHNTDAALPYWDAAILVLSVFAQYLMSRKIMECWVLWLIVDIMSIGVFWIKDLHLTSGLYVIFFCLAASGLYNWVRDWRTQEEEIVGTPPKKPKRKLRVVT